MSARGKGEPTWGDEIVHPGDLIVDGNTTFLIENCTFTVTGIVKVGDNATLIVRNAELNVSTDTVAGMVILDRNGALTIVDGELNLNYFTEPSIAQICDIDVRDTATLDVKNSSISSRRGSISFRINQHGRLTLNSTSTRESNIKSFDDSDISIYGTPIHSINLHGNSSCVVQNTEVRYFSGSERYTATFYNSTIRRIEFVFGSSSKVFMDSRLQGSHRYWNIYANLTVEGIECNLTLHDTAITGLPRLDSVFNSTGMELRVLNQDLRSANIGRDSELHMTNCSCKHLLCGRHDSTYCINDSRIDRLSLLDNAFASISETKIDELEVSDFEGALVFDKVTLNERLDIEFGIPGSQFYVCGGLSFGTNLSINEGPIYEGPSYRANLTGPMQKFNVVRGYRVVASRDGKPLENARLKLCNGEDELIWEGATDGNGEADFNITYCKNWILPPGYYYSNHTNTWNLEAIYGPLSYATDVAFLSETPITFNFPIPKPLWATWQFWTGIIIFITAAVFTTFYIYTTRRTSRI